MKGNITIEAALVIPLVFLIIGLLMLLGVKYNNYVFEESQRQLSEDRLAITGEQLYREVRPDNILMDNGTYIEVMSVSGGVNVDYVNPKKVVRVADAIDDLTDMISITSGLKKNYSDFFDGIITGF